jgi:tetrahydromethanopterin S-methyltransferase subunit G
MIEVEFKEYSKKFKEYMEKSVKEIALLEKEGKYEEALQKKNKIYQSQEFMFGDKLPKIIGKLSDIDGIQSFLKETNFREISDRLSSIQELIKTGNRELAQDLIKDYNEKIIKNKRIDAKLKDKLNL